jgi:nucleotide-binding universal stress UspA family protein
MSNFFSNILVPVDFSLNTEVAIDKAIWLAVPGFTIIHLLHVQKPVSKAGEYHINGFSAPAVETSVHNSRDAEKKLKEMKSAIEMSVQDIIVVTHLLHAETVQKGIMCLAKQLHPSVIIIGESKKHKWFAFFKKVNTSLLAKETDCPVLTVKPGSIPNRMKSIVMPVRSFAPNRKIELLSALTRNHRPVIHLVTMYHDEKFNSRAEVFLDAYRTLSDYLHYPVEYRTLRGSNIAKAVFDYAQFIMADFIIANPVEETKVNNIYGTDICDMIAPDSKLSILTAEPFHH